MPLLGQQAIYRLESSRFVHGVVSKIISGNTVQLVCHNDGLEWGGGDPSVFGTKIFDNVDLGFEIGEWQPSTLIDDMIAGCLLIPGSSSSIPLAANTPRQPNTTRPVIVTIVGSWSWNLVAIGTQTGSLTLISDSSSTPTTAIYSPSWSRGIGVGLTVNDTGTMPIFLSYIVPPEDFYKVTVTGGATFVVREQIL